MSATYIKDIKIYKTEWSFYKNQPEYKTNIYAIVFTTADSNVFNANGSLFYHDECFYVGEYDEAFYEICRFSGNFESQICQWNGKKMRPENFIKKCREAFVSATETILLPSKFIIDYSTSETRKAMERLAAFPSIEKENFYSEIILKTDNIMLLYFVKYFLKDWKKSKMDIVEFCKENKKHYPEELIYLFI